MRLQCGCGNEVEFVVEPHRAPPVDGMGAVTSYSYYQFSILTAMEGEVIGIKCHNCGEEICFYE